MSGWDLHWRLFEEESGRAIARALSDAAPVSGSGGDYAERWVDRASAGYGPGTLAGSMVWEDRDGDLTAGSRDPRGPIARYVAWGTRPHGIDPVYARALHFFSPTYGEVFASHVDHPGTAPNPFHIEAWQQVAPEVVGNFRRIMGPGAVLAYLNPRRFRQIDI